MASKRDSVIIIVVIAGIFSKVPEALLLLQNLLETKTYWQGTHYARIVDEKVAQDMFNLTQGGKFQLAR